MTYLRRSMLAALLASPCAAAPSKDEDQVAETLRTMYTALTTDDLTLFRSVVTAGFYAFDGGKRFEGDALLNLIKTSHQSGAVFVWTVNEPDVHISGNMAWISYTNRGSVQRPSGTQNVTWLESAVLEKDSSRWRIRFFHSTRVPQP